MKIKYLYLVLILMILTSCSKKIFFTNEVKKKIDEKELNIKRVQFYNSEKIILSRSIPHDEAEITNGEVKFENGQFIEEVLIRQGTPGICDEGDKKELDISFERGGDKVITFKLNELTGYYEIAVDYQPDGLNTIVYDSIRYKIQPSSENAKLMIRKDDKYIYKINQRVAEGVTVR